MEQQRNGHFQTKLDEKQWKGNFSVSDISTFDRSFSTKFAHSLFDLKFSFPCFSLACHQQPSQRNSWLGWHYWSKSKYSKRRKITFVTAFHWIQSVFSWCSFQMKIVRLSRMFWSWLRIFVIMCCLSALWAIKEQNRQYIVATTRSWKMWHLVNSSTIEIRSHSRFWYASSIRRDVHPQSRPDFSSL